MKRETKLKKNDESLQLLLNKRPPAVLKGFCDPAEIRTNNFTLKLLPNSSNLA